MYLDFEEKMEEYRMEVEGETRLQLESVEKLCTEKVEAISAELGNNILIFPANNYSYIV